MFIPRHHKTYLSRAMTRAMATDHPIGDPHGGPAYGERNDPISAIASIGSMFASGGLTAAGFALGGLNLAQGLMFAGGALGLLGGVTGNKTLSRLGMVAGLAGGIGQLAGIGTETTLGGLFGGGEAAAATGAPGAALGQTPTANPVPSQVDVLSEMAAGPANTGPLATGVETFSVPNQPSLASQPLGQAPSMAGTGNGGWPGAFEDLAPGIQPGASPGIISSAASPPAVAPPSVAAPTVAGTGNGGWPGAFEDLAPGVKPPTAPAVSAGGYDALASGAAPAPGAITNPTDLRLHNGMQSTPMAAPPKSFLANIGSGFLELTKTNPGAAMMLAGTINGAMDVLSGKAGAQINALEAQGELSKAQADKIRFEMEEFKRKQRNINEGYANVQNPLIGWKPPAAERTPRPGLVAGAMAPA